MTFRGLHGKPSCYPMCYYCALAVRTDATRLAAPTRGTIRAICAYASPDLKNLKFLIGYSVIAYLVVRFFVHLEYIILICPLYIEFCVHYCNCVPRETLGGSGGVVGEGLQVCVSGITRTLKVCHLEAIWENCSRHP